MIRTSTLSALTATLALIERQGSTAAVVVAPRDTGTYSGAATPVCLRVSSYSYGGSYASPYITFGNYGRNTGDTDLHPNTRYVPQGLLDDLLPIYRRPVARAHRRPPTPVRRAPSQRPAVIAVSRRGMRRCCKTRNVHVFRHAPRRPTRRTGHLIHAVVRLKLSALIA